MGRCNVDCNRTSSSYCRTICKTSSIHSNWLWCLDNMEKRVVENYELDPDNREWQYDCEGNKVVKGDFTKLWQPDIQSEVSEELIK